MSHNPFSAEGNWYKGNLHTHTTLSDGTLTPRQVVETYHGEGYQFLALTDHNLFVKHSRLNTPAMLLLPGVEVTTANRSKKADEIVVHTLAISKQEYPELPDGFAFRPDQLPLFRGMQDYLDFLRAKGFLLILAHPCWSGLEVCDYLDLVGYTGIELYNTSCESDGGTAYSVSQWDALLRRGIPSLGFAADDMHSCTRRGWDWGGGFIMVKAPALTHACIVSAIENGCFYSTQGPRIDDFQYHAATNTVTLQSSPAKRIRFICYERKGKGLLADDADHLLESAEFVLRQDGINNYVRAEVEDEEGRMAYTNPIFLKESYSKKKFNPHQEVGI